MADARPEIMPAYLAAQNDLGVPALYYAERMDRSDEKITANDLAVVAAGWAMYRASLDTARANGQTRADLT